MPKNLAYAKVKHPRMKKVTSSKLTVEFVPANPKEHKKYVAVIKKWYKDEENWHKEDQRNLHRLIDIRPFLWT